MLRNVFDAAFEWVEEAIDVLKRNTLLRFCARREVITNYGSVCTSTSTRRRSITLKNLILFCLFVVVVRCIDGCTLNKHRFLDFSLYGTAKCKEFSVIVVMYLQFKYAVFPQKNNP